MYLLVEGNVAAVKTFPSKTGYISPLNISSTLPQVYKASCYGRQQLISVGRSQVLSFTYLWKEPLTQEGWAPEVLVTDLSGVKINPGETDFIPRNKTLCFKSVFDGEIVIYNNHRVVDKRKLSSDNYVEIDGLTYGLIVQVIIGIDIVWQIVFRKRRPIIEKDEFEVLKQITNVAGRTISIPHSLRNILVDLRRYPLLWQWIRKRIKIGSINEQSYRRLQTFYRDINGNC